MNKSSTTILQVTYSQEHKQFAPNCSLYVLTVLKQGSDSLSYLIFLSPFLFLLSRSARAQCPTFETRRISTAKTKNKKLICWGADLMSACRTQ